MAKKAEAATPKQLRITLKKSTIACSPKQKATVEALGLRKVGMVTVQNDTPTLQGKLKLVGHLLCVEDVK